MAGHPESPTPPHLSSQLQKQLCQLQVQGLVGDLWGGGVHSLSKAPPSASSSRPQQSRTSRASRSALITSSISLQITGGRRGSGGGPRRGRGWSPRAVGFVGGAGADISGRAWLGMQGRGFVVPPAGLDGQGRGGAGAGQGRGERRLTLRCGCVRKRCAG